MIDGSQRWLDDESQSKKPRVSELRELKVMDHCNSNGTEQHKDVFLVAKVLLLSVD